ncbi:MAG: UDP-N-acetylmuramoyl-tripeptide--D-alanyl-D-alanine ligase, partial [Gemmatimonadetes bacterium]
MSAPFVWTDEAVRRALGLEGGEAEPAYYAVGTDTRTLPAGALFVALEGPRFDGHAFVAEAAAAGARGVVVHRPVEAPAGVAVYRVADTLQALGALARYRREALRTPVVAVTGSSGKTSTKAFLEAALAAGRRVHATPGNLNNRVGLPLTLLAAPDEAEVVVLEMGTSEPGEIAALTEVARPDVGVVTTVAEAHVEGLGSLEGVLAEKLALLRGLAPDGRALVGAEPPLLAEAARALRADVRVAGWGEAADADLTPVDVHRMDDGRWGFTWRGEQVALGVPGRHAVTNALLALAVAETLGVPAAAAARAVG